MTRDRCGFHIYDPSYFYAIYWEFFRDSYDSDPEKIKKNLEYCGTRKFDNITF